MVRRNILRACLKIQQKKVIIHRLSLFLFIFAAFYEKLQKNTLLTIKKTV